MAKSLDSAAKKNLCEILNYITADCIWHTYVTGQVRFQLKRDGKQWRTGGEVKGKLASTLHTTSKHGVSRITTADAHNSATSIRLNWSPPPI
jgi:hypothetical protein